MSWAKTELASGVIRVWADDAKYGDKFTYVVNISRVPGNPQICELLAVMRAPTVSERRAIGKELIRLGYTHFISSKGDGTQKLYDVKTGRRVRMPANLIAEGR